MLPGIKCPKGTSQWYWKNQKNKLHHELIVHYYILFIHLYDYGIPSQPSHILLASFAFLVILLAPLVFSVSFGYNFVSSRHHYTNNILFCLFHVYIEIIIKIRIIFCTSVKSKHNLLDHFWLWFLLFISYRFCESGKCLSSMGKSIENQRINTKYNSKYLTTIESNWKRKVLNWFCNYFDVNCLTGIFVVLAPEDENS